MQKIYSVEEYLELNSKYNEGLELLRSILLKTELQETIKWSIPTYVINGKNVISIAAFKDYFGLWFFNGVFLSDKHNVLINAQKDKTKGQRQWRFKDASDINEGLVLSYVREAINNQKQGLEILPDRSKKELVIPKELKILLDSNSDIKSSFDGLTLYKQREYCEYISSAKRDTTKQNRLKKIKPMLLQNIGLSDKYRNC